MPDEKKDQLHEQLSETFAEESLSEGNAHASSGASETAAGQTAPGPGAADAVQPAQLDSFDASTSEAPGAGDGAGAEGHRGLDLILDVEVLVSAELGRTEMPIGQILELGPGSIVELDKMASDPVDLFINNKLIARGEVVVVDENFGVRITSVVDPRQRVKSLG